MQVYAVNVYVSQALDELKEAERFAKSFGLTAVKYNTWENDVLQIEVVTDGDFEEMRPMFGYDKKFWDPFKVKPVPQKIHLKKDGFATCSERRGYSLTDDIKQVTCKRCLHIEKAKK
jgi:hypothetical protein